MKKLLALTLLSSSLLGGTAHGLQHPKTADDEHRVKTVVYDPHDVVQINTIAGVVTHIALEPGERHSTHQFGDSEAYGLEQHNHHIFIKPMAEDADTNLIYITDYPRTYRFRLTYQESRANATYEVSFQYPDKERELFSEILEQEAIEEQLHVSHSGYNLAYSKSGSADIQLLNVWDDSQFTYFKFAANTDIPAIYMSDNDGQEILVNRTTKGDANNIAALHRIAENWVLRVGNHVLAVRNDKFNAAGVENNSGTISPLVIRELNGDDSHE